MNVPRRARAFHSTPPRNGLPVIPLFLSFLKTSSAIQLASTVSRIALTFMPIALLNRLKSRRKLQRIDARIKDGKASDSDELQKRRETVTERLRNSTRLFQLVLFTPIVLFWLTIVASLERTPLTGRLRLILLSPDEEEDIAAQLAGPGWYRAIGEILTQNGTTRLVDPGDWRYQWVLSTLRRLESVIPVLQYEEGLRPDWMDGGPNDIPQPPPAQYPLRPRPRASDYFRRFAEAARHRTAQTPAHSIPGPPYSLLVVDDPDSSNAFSYGFGPDGGGGVVVFSGFLEDVLRKYPHAFVEEPQPTSWWSYIFGNFFGLSPRPPAHPVPTEEQTSELAILLAHELAHLVLTHHIETLSTGTIIWPGVITIFTDIVRSLLFPVTMLFGPFINDALASVGKASSGEISRITEYCTSQSQEVEADIVSARLLAHAGFDPRHAIHFWEGRNETPKTAECTPGLAEEMQRAEETSLLYLPRRWIGSSHPINLVRVQRLRDELDRWEKARFAAREKREKERGKAADASAAAE
ncbi:peptidase family M48-domain-containing protein [Fomitopsis serialis]|uniref:peptidase family M48-domain-containing protein n=1 Tax=Fomitopsis serialis TaxID=139415 RepID=UPI0020081D99|nr:peptidase family M48-domain-containing protein [Neoantrodia serialis]KAH9917033.1 peptidase family M48-domain-containing protein [Neoantrodia serialis]